MPTKFIFEIAPGDVVKGEVLFPGQTQRIGLTVAMVQPFAGLLHFTDGSSVRVQDPTVPIEML